MPNIKLTDKFNKLADGMQPDIDRKLAPRLENTAKRAREAASMRNEARRLEKVQAGLRALAKAYRDDAVPDVLLSVISKKQVDELFYYKPTEQTETLTALIEAYVGGAVGALTAADKIRDIERDLIGRKIDGFFPTPAKIVNIMIDKGDIQRGHIILEPSAGKGNIVDGLKKLPFYDELAIDVIEPVPSLRNILELKGYNIVASDCLEAKIDDPFYSRVLMNPPFEKGADMDHVQHCFNMFLRPGGRLVAIMSEGSFFRSDKKATGFREWLSQYDHTVTKLDAGEFYESGTNIPTRLVVINKPGAVSEPTVMEVVEPYLEALRAMSVEDYIRRNDLIDPLID
jgi:hypothetical protein